MANIMETSFRDFISNRRGGLGKGAGGKVASPEIKSPATPLPSQVAPPISPPVTSAPVVPVSQPTIPRPDAIPEPVLRREEVTEKRSPLEELKRRRTERESQGIQTQPEQIGQPAQDPTELANKQAMLGNDTGGRGIISNFISGLEKKTGVSRKNPLIQALPGIGTAVRTQTKLEQAGQGDLLEQTGIAFSKGLVDQATFIGDAVQAAAAVPANRDKILQGTLLQILDPTKGGIDAALDALNAAGMSPEDSLAQITQVMTDPALRESRILSEELDAAITNPLAKPLAFAAEVAIPGIGASETKVIKKGVEAVKKTAQELTGAVGEKVVPLAKEGLQTAKVKAGEAVEAVGEKISGRAAKKEAKKRTKDIEEIAKDLDPSLGKGGERARVLQEGRAIEGEGIKQGKIKEFISGTKRAPVSSSQEVLDVAAVVHDKIPNAKNMTKQKKFLEMGKEGEKIAKELQPQLKVQKLDPSSVDPMKSKINDIRVKQLDSALSEGSENMIEKQYKITLRFLEDLKDGEKTLDDLWAMRKAFDKKMGKIKDYDRLNGKDIKKDIIYDMWKESRQVMNEALFDGTRKSGLDDKAKESFREMSLLFKGQDNIISRTTKSAFENQDKVKGGIITKERVLGGAALIGVPAAASRFF